MSKWAGDQEPAARKALASRGLLVEMGAANTMRRAGFPMERFMVGDRLEITGNPGRRDRTILLNETVLPDGTRLTPTMRPRDRTGTASSGD